MSVPYQWGRAMVMVGSRRPARPPLSACNWRRSVDPDPDFATSKSGEVVFLLDTPLKAGASREFTLTFGTPTTNPTKALVIASDGTDEGHDARIVKSAAQTFKYQKTAGAFSSLEDPSGADWIDHHHEDHPSSSGEWRGVPNFEVASMLLPPGHDLERLRPAPVRAGAPELARRRDQRRRRYLQEGQLERALRHLPGRATFTMEEAADTYWMMYASGGPAGKNMADAAKQYMYDSAGTKTFMTKAFDVKAGEQKEQHYIVVDPDTKQSMFFIHHDGNAMVHYQRQSTMTVMGFGRQPNPHVHGHLDGRPHVSIGIVQNGLDFAEQQTRAKGLIEQHRRSVDVTLVE